MLETTEQAIENLASDSYGRKVYKKVAEKFSEKWRSGKLLRLSADEISWAWHLVQMRGLDVWIQLNKKEHQTDIWFRLGDGVRVTAFKSPYRKC